ncbi:MAG: hypothetical protein OEV06_09080, partial [Anaerolineae bacterium]|nr:hypothetical protein [Anaerolineae bacterium]
LPVMEALKRGWNVVKDNIGSFVVLGLVLLVGGFILSVILAMPFFAILIPIIVAAAEGSQDSILGVGLVSLLCVVAYLPILLVVSGIVQAYIKSAWTLTFMRLTSNGEAESEKE